MKSPPLTLMSLGLALVAGCTGTVGSDSPPSSAPTTGGSAGAGSPSVPANPGSNPIGGGLGPNVCEVTAIGKAPERLVTRSQYANLLRDVLAPVPVDADAWVEGLPAEQQGAGFATNADATVSQLHLSKLLAVADKAAEAVNRDFASLGLACQGGRDCAVGLVQRLGSRAYRRTLAAPEVEVIVARLFDPEASFAAGVAQVIRGLLLAADTLYQYEVGTPSASALSALTPADLASKLSFFLWDSVPDDELRQAAEAGALSTPAAFDAQVERLLASPRANATVARFYREWLHVGDPEEKSTEVFPAFTPEFYRESVLGELDRFTEEATLSGTGTLESLLQASHAYVTPELAGLYGVAHPGGDMWARVELDPTQRSGLLTRLAFLASTSHAESTAPTIRGKSILNQLTCASVGEPPADVQDRFPQLPEDDTKTTRQRLTETTSIEARCQGCHLVLDPLGLAFEHYDAVGRYRDTENGLPIDTKVETAYGSVANAVEFSKLLAADQAVAQCFTDNWFNFTMLREAIEADACAVEQLRADFGTSGKNLKQLMLAVLKNPAFHYRSAQ